MLFFLDSGSYSLLTKSIKYCKATPGANRWSYYDTSEHWEYVDKYAEFVNKYKNYIDHYANIDAIGNAELTWRNQKYLEKKGLNPVPVFHQSTSMKWLSKYIEEGYDFIALGGMVGTGFVVQVKSWLDNCFNIICDTPDRLPKIRAHGFGVTAYDLMLSYPWYSVDSATWTKVGAFGSILVPQRRAGKFVYDCPPYVVKVSEESPSKETGTLFSCAGTSVKGSILKEWLKEINVPYGKGSKTDSDVEWGVCNRHTERKIANLLFFEKLRDSMPKYPWPFKVKENNIGFGL